MARKRRFSNEPFGPTIQSLMTERGTTYRALAEKTGLSAGYLNHLVHGNRPVPSDDVIRTLASALGVDPLGWLPSFQPTTPDWWIAAYLRLVPALLLVALLAVLGWRRARA